MAKARLCYVKGSNALEWIDCLPKTQERDSWKVESGVLDLVLWTGTEGEPSRVGGWLRSWLGISGAPSVGGWPTFEPRIFECPICRASDRCGPSGSRSHHPLSRPACVHLYFSCTFAQSRRFPHRATFRRGAAWKNIWQRIEHGARDTITESSHALARPLLQRAKGLRIAIRSLAAHPSPPFFCAKLLDTRAE